MAGNVGTPGVGVAERLFRVLDAFGPSATQLTLSEIATRADLPISTARRMISDLQREGALSRVDQSHYRIGLHLWELGVLAPEQSDIRVAAAPLMHDLSRATGETTQLVVLDGHEALCVERISAAAAVPNKTQIGGRLPLHATAVGKCLLSYSPRELFVEIVALGLPRLTPYTVTHVGRLDDELRKIRQTSVAFSREEMSVGAASVASPILSSDGSIRGAIGAVVHSTVNLNHLAAAVKTAALNIARTAG